MKARVFLLAVLVLCLLACNLGSLAAPTPTSEPTATPTVIATATKTPTLTATPTLDPSSVVSLPELRFFAALVAQTYPFFRYADHIGVERGTRIYLKVELEDGVYLAVFGDVNDQWGLLEMVPMEPTPLPAPGREAQREW